MAGVPLYERKAKKLVERGWDDLKGAWLPFVPPDGYPADAGITDVRDLPGLSQDAGAVQDENPALRPMLDGLPTLVLGEALRLLHKAIHVLGATQVHVGAGMCSWSNASGYQAALFGAHAIVRLLRVVTVQFDASHYVVDLWPEPAKKRAARGGEMLILKMPGAILEHRPVWALFLRMLRVTDVRPDVWPPLLVSELVQLEPEDCAHQRNALHYKLAAWPLPDLREAQVIPGFGALAPVAEGCLDAGRDDFSVRLGIGVLRLAAGLLNDLAAAAPSLAPDAASLSAWIAGANYPVYRASAI